MRWLAVMLFVLAPGLHGAESFSSFVRPRDGAVVNGEAINREFTVHAAYGSITIASSLVAQLRFGVTTEFDWLVTVGGNRFTGFVNEAVRLRATDGQARSFNKFEIEELMLRPLALTNLTRYVVLMNGDLLSGEFSLPAISITNAAGAETLSPEKLDSLWFEINDSAIQVQLVDGSQIRAVYPERALKIKLDAGGGLDLPRGFLKTVYCRRESIPPEVHRLLASSGERSSTNASFPAPSGMVWIPPGAVLLGSPLDERGRNSDEDPQTHVTITRGFWMAQHEVTQGKYAAVMGQNPSTFQGDTNRPVEKVSWHEANEYCARLTERARKDGSLPAGCVFRLPTEAEWEYACRAGTNSRFSFGDDPDERELPEYAWFVGNSGWSTHPVGRLKPNAWGLYDMHGNVLEWCAGIWNDSYPGGKAVDYKGPTEGWLRVARGGSWLYGGALARSANRDDYGAGNRCSDLGFRVVLGAER